MGQANCTCQSQGCVEGAEENVIDVQAKEVDLSIPIDDSNCKVEDSEESGLTTQSTNYPPSPSRSGRPRVESDDDRDEDDFGVASPTPKGCEKGTSELSKEAGDEIVAAALAKVEVLMKDYDILEAESVLAQALGKLGCLHQEEEVQVSATAQNAAAKLRASQPFKDVEEWVSQYDPTVDMLFSDNFKLLYENEWGKMELYQPEGEQWFDYRMTVFIDAPLAECLSTSHELDLIPLAQACVHEKPVRVGPENGFVAASVTKMPALIFNVELFFESLRVRDKRAGFLLESIRGSNFPLRGRQVPDKPWRTIRPWAWVANAWIPRGGGKEGTVLVQVTRVDAGFHIPNFVLNWTFRQMATGFMRDLRETAQKAMTDGSPWKKRISEDKVSLYGQLKEVDTLALNRAEVTSLPSKEFFENRPWRLRPVPQSTRPQGKQD